jgi:hypothetical protein
MVHNDLYSLGKFKVFITCWADLSRKECDAHSWADCILVEEAVFATRIGVLCDSVGVDLVYVYNRYCMIFG